jgi:hypothetical protein
MRWSILLIAACGGAPSPAPAAVPDLVIPPMGSAANVVAPAPPPSPAAPAPVHRPTDEECDAIMQQVVSLTMGSQASALTSAQHEAIVKQFVTGDFRQTVCGAMLVDDESMRCVRDSKSTDDLTKCVVTGRSNHEDDND